MTKKGKKKNSTVNHRKDRRREALGINLDAQKPCRVGQDDISDLQLNDELAEGKIDQFLCSKSPEWSLKYLESQVESYEVLAPAYDDEERISWIKIYFMF
jgi:hypothetical protein